MLKRLTLLVFLLTLLSGCNQPEEEEFIFPEAVFTISPETTQVNATVLFQVNINAGDKAVEDADVKFEIWQDGQEDSEHIMIPVEHQSDGTYILEKSFETPGTYFVYYHADALSLHMMDKKSFVITE